MIQSIIFFRYLHSMILLAIFILVLILRCLYWNITSPSAHWYDDPEPDDIKQGFQGSPIPMKYIRPLNQLVKQKPKDQQEITGEQIIWYPDEFLNINPPGEKIRISNTAYPRYTYAMDGIVHIPNSNYS